MAEHFIDAAIRTTENGRDVAYFFILDRFVVWDWANDRCQDGVRALTGLNPPLGFAPAPPLLPAVAEPSVDTGLRGKGNFDGFYYLFARGNYVRYTLAPAVTFDPPSTSDASVWQLPFAHIDAAFNGALNRDDFCYFFSGSNYVRYSWSADRPDGPAKPISAMIGIAPAFAGGIDAAVDGGGSFANAGYMFREDRYLRFDWADGAEEPHGNADQALQGNWLGLAEMLAAAKATSIALTWLSNARGQLGAYRDALNGMGIPQPLVAAALATHFHAGPLDVATVNQVITNLAAIDATLRNEQMIRFRTDAQAINEDGSTDVDAAYTGPMPVDATTRISVTSNFLKRSERNRILSVMHEAWHANDSLSVAPNVHVPEWFLSAPAAALFGIAFQGDRADITGRYDLMNTADALHNAAAYATFVQHVALGTDSRALP